MRKATILIVMALGGCLGPGMPNRDMEGAGTDLDSRGDFPFFAPDLALVGDLGPLSADQEQPADLGPLSADQEQLADLGAASADRPDAGAMVFGKQLAAGRFLILTITADGYAILLDDKGAVLAQPINGGNAELIMKPPLFARMFGRAVGKIALIYEWDLVNGGAVAGWVWTKAAGVHELHPPAQDSEVPPDFGASDDGTWIAYYANPSFDSIDLMSVHPDGSHPSLVVHMHSQGGCLTLFDFVGNYVLALNCTDGAVHSYDAAGHDTVLANVVMGDWISDWNSSTGTVQMDYGSVYPASGGKPIFTSEGGLSESPYLGDQFMLYNPGAALYRVDLAKGAKTLLRPAPSDMPRAVSPDGRFMSFDFEMPLLASALAPGPPIATGDANTSSWLFTADSAFLLYNPSAQLPVTLAAQPTAGGPPRALGAGFSPRLVGGARAVFGTNQNPSPAPAFGVSWSFDLMFVDLAKQAPASLIATSADDDYLLTPDRKSVVYAYQADPNAAGLYIVALP